MKNWRSDMKQMSILFLLYCAHIYVFTVTKLHIDINTKKSLKVERYLNIK